ncbi:Phosphodiesterase/alkaline phosphatase D [Nannocystis exedens]|uniref:Phosphodiesterase/alkaline phosphatase D n=1 Tax=Nannocystis exedens TaxID=54 RepID=A0A1I2BXD6_9BACT|nr:alkaline phosphatase D family protein [Nannocystis exedens]PCC71237.1 alkaline phosphatase [Nannocystis exedens]SFE59970.1 Phosphodiesterase/alkaline phosphatase D [Nannocystis exedens]
MFSIAQTTSKVRLSASLATAVALACLVAPDGLSSPVLGLFLFGGAAFLVAGFVALDLLGAVLPAGGLTVRRLRRVAALVLSAPLLLLTALILGFQSSALVVALPAGLVFAVAVVVAVERLAPRLGAPEDPRFWLATAVAAVELVALFLYVHVSEDTFAVVRPGTERLHAVLWFGTWAASLALLLPWGARVASRAGAAPPSRWWTAWSGLAALVGLGFMVADRRFMVGLYPAVHLWLQLVAVLSLDAALSRGLALAQLERRRLAPATIRKLTRAGGLALALVAAAAAGFAVVAFGGYASDRGFRAQVGESTVGTSMMRFLRRGEGRTRGHLKELDHPLYHDVPPPQNDWNILLISVDALRADALPDPDEADKRAAPRLSALGAQCADFRRAYAPGSRTAIGMGALMLGRYSAHIQWDLWMWDGKLINPNKATAADIRGLTNGVQYTTIPQIPPEGNLAQRMKAAGLRTLATPWDGYSRFFRKDAGFDPGFDEYTDFNPMSFREPASPKVLPIALQQLDKAKGVRFFQWVHLFDPHESGGDRERYAELVQEMDAALGDFLDGLEQRGLRDKTAIFLVADHGEALGDHRNATHGTSLYEEQVRVPMMICLPGRKGQVFRQPVSTLDATATMLALAGGDLTGIDGVNLLPLIEDGTYPAERPVFTELHRYMSNQAQRTTDLQAVINGRWKLIRDLKNDTVQLFDLENDPKEEQSALSSRPDVADDLEDLLDALNADRAKPKPPKPLFAAKPAAFEPGQDSVILWARSTLPASIHFELAKNARFKDALATTAREVTPEGDHVRVVDVTGLDPGTRYWYRAVLTHEGERLVSDTASFTTAPDKPRNVKLAWSADLLADNAPFQIFGPLKREKPDVFLMLGDTMYADIPKKNKGKDLKTYRARHKLVRRDENLQSFLASTATAAIWDDHEISNNAHRETENLAVARQVFREQWPVRSADPEDVGLYRSFRPAPQVEVFILDVRSFRDLPGRNRTMLGEAQKEWFITSLKSSTARTKIVVTSVPMFAPFGQDSWNAFPDERDELRTVFASEPPGTVFVLSGDYHLAWHLVDQETGIHELIAGPLDAWVFEDMLPQHMTDVAKRGGFAITDGPNYGVLEVKQDGSVVVRYHDVKGKQKYRAVLTGPDEVPAPGAAKEPPAAPERAVTGSSAASAGTGPTR